MQQKQPQKVWLVVLFVVLAATAQTALADDVYIPHLSCGDSNWTINLIADSNRLSPDTFTLTLYTDGTQSFQQDYTASALTQTVIDISALSTTADSGMVSYTYSEPELNFRLGYVNLAGGGMAEFKLTGEVSNSQAFYFSDYASGLTWKAMALANFGGTTASVMLYALGDQSLLGSQQLSMAPNTRVFGLHTSWFPDVDTDDVKKIVAVSTSGSLTGLAASGNSTNSQILFTAASPIIGFSVPSYPTSVDVSGTWTGTWRSTSYIGESGSLTISMTQSDSSVSGSLSATDTDCGDVSGVAISGSVSGSTISFSASYTCQGSSATLEYTQGIILDNSISGVYNAYVDADLYDKGIFTLTRQ